jgi:hypothetical protein
LEEHRLTPMVKDYDEALFNQLYADTKYLRIKLVSGIDPHRYNVDREELLSWFDVKFIFIFNKYYGKVGEGRLKGQIIQGLQFFKNRVLRYGYTQKNQVNQTVDISEFYNIESHEFTVIEESDTPSELASLIPLFKSKLDPLAFHLFTIEYNPPLYILYRLDKLPKEAKLPDNLLCEYMGLPHDEGTHQLLQSARKRYKKLINSLKN